MLEIVSRVQELAALAESALPRAVDVTALADASETALLIALSSLRAQVDASISVVAADIERKSARELGAAGLARRAGAKSGVELVQKLTGVTRADATRSVRAGEMLEAAEQVAPASMVDAGSGALESDDDGFNEGDRKGTRAFDPGPRSFDVLSALAGTWDAPVAVAIRNRWLSIDQGDAIRRGLGGPRTLAVGGAAAPDADDHARWRDAALRLIDICWEGNLTPEDLRKHAAQLRDILDREWAAESAGRLREQRSLRRVTRTDGMVKYDLLVDPMTDAEIWTPVFRQLAPRLGGPRFMTSEEQARAAELEADVRSNEQLLADVFIGFLIAGVSGTGAVGAYVPTVNIAITAGDLRTAIATDHATRAHHRGDHSHCSNSNSNSNSGPPGGRCDGPPAAVALGWLGGKPESVAGSQLLTAICTGDRLATLFDDTGQALDVTKTERTYSHRQRTAMALRDGGCLISGCTMPPGACEAHHINPWGNAPHNRTTETRDGVLLCRFHHLNLHHQGGSIRRRGSEYWLCWPGQETTRLIPKHGLMAQLLQSDDSSAELA